MTTDRIHAFCRSLLAGDSTRAELASALNRLQAGSYKDSPAAGFLATLLLRQPRAAATA